MVVTPLQATILLCFNSSSALSLQQLIDVTQATIEEIKTATIPMLSPAHSVLLVESQTEAFGRKLSENSTLLLNGNFFPRKKIDFLQYSSQLEVIISQKDAAQMAQLRTWKSKVVESAIVKSLKGAGVRPASDIIEEVRRAVQKWHNVSDEEVQQCIETLTTSGIINSHASTKGNLAQPALSYLADGTENGEIVRVLTNLTNTSNIVGAALFKLMVVKFRLPINTTTITYDEFYRGMLSLALNQRFIFEVTEAIQELQLPLSQSPAFYFAHFGWNKSVTVSNCKEGTRVIRGKDWKWGNQDGGVGSLGTVIGPGSNWMGGWCQVQWDNGECSNYRFGAEGKFDLFIAPQPPNQSVTNAQPTYSRFRQTKRLVKKRNPQLEDELHLAVYMLLGYLQIVLVTSVQRNVQAVLFQAGKNPEIDFPIPSSQEKKRHCMLILEELLGHRLNFISKGFLKLLELSKKDANELMVRDGGLLLDKIVQS